MAQSTDIVVVFYSFKDGSQNSNPLIVGKYFFDCGHCVVQVRGTPRICRCVSGIDNVNIAAMQRFLRRKCSRRLSGDKSFLYGKSVSNQRIEGLWAFLRTGGFHFLKIWDGSLLNGDNYIHMHCLKFCFMPVLRAKLQRPGQHWNLHKSRPSKNKDSPVLDG